MNEKGEAKMYKEIEKLSYVFLIAVALATPLVTMTRVKGNPYTTLTIKPPVIIDPSIAPGSTIVINASVVGITALYSWQVAVFFDKNLLNCTRAWYPSDHVFAGKLYMPLPPTIDNDAGYIVHGNTLMGADPGFTGNGTLCQIEFKVLSRGFCNLNFSDEDTILLDPNQRDIPAVLIDGYFDNRLGAPKPPVALFDYTPKPVLVDQWVTFDASASYDPDGTIVNYQWNFGDSGTGSGKIVTHKYLSAGTFQVNLTVTDNEGLKDSEIKEIVVYEAPPARLYIDPPEIINFTLRPPSIVTVNVTVDDVIGMYDYEFRLSYNTEMLTCIGALINRVQGETHFTPYILIDDGAGYIWINVTYHPPAIPITTETPLALVTVYFQIDTLGSSVLHLSNTELSDTNRQPMPHETGDGFIMTAVRDVAIVYVASSTSWAYQGWPVDITVVAKNLGNISESFDVKVYYDGNLIGTQPVVNLAPNTEITLNFTWDTSGVLEGNYTLTGEATTVPFEYDTANNVLVDGIVRIFTTIRDVAIISVVPSRNWAFPGVPVNITVTAKNFGETTESFDVKAYYDSNLIGTYPVVNLPPATEIVIVFTWDTSGLEPCHNYTITSEATIIPYEYNTANNILVDGTVKIRYIGDINGDGKVDIRDVTIAAQAFGSYPGHPRWNPDADVTGPTYLVPDGKVDIRDITLISQNFGKGC
jgi:PKD repeat protein